MSELLDLATAIPSPSKERVASLIVNSFRFSRGSADLQEKIFWFFAHKYGENIDSSVIDDSIEIAVAAASKIYNNPKTHIVSQSGENPYVTAESEVAAQAKEFKKALRDSKIISLDVDTLCTATISADHRWVAGHREQPLSELPRPYRSNFAHFGILGNSTNIDEFNAFYQTVAERVIGLDQNTLPENSDLRVELLNLPAIIREHLIYQPDDEQRLSRFVQ